MEQLLATPHAVHMHKSAEELAVYVACSDIKLVAPATIEAGASTTLDVRSDNDLGLQRHRDRDRPRQQPRARRGSRGRRRDHATAPAHPRWQLRCLEHDDPLDFRWRRLPMGFPPRTSRRPCSNWRDSHALHMHKSAEELTVYVACADIVLPAVGERYTVVRDSLSSIAEC